MNTIKFKELLAGKIDNYERWAQVCRECGTIPVYVRDDYRAINTPFHLGSFGQYGYINHRRALSVEQDWWMVREEARIRLGVYPPASNVMQMVSTSFHLQAHFIHVSRDDPNMVAYTASMEDGLRDKQVRLSFGKLLRRFMLLATDAHIQAMEASHRSEMDPTFKVATTIEDIERVYTTMDGDSGCMRYGGSNWDLPDGLHPSHAYCYAGLGVAYTEVDGVVKSRSVIYDNPENPKDKRYVRIYGDPCLKRKLELAGYRLSHLDGAKLRAISLYERDPDEYRRDTHMVPYLDGPGGNQNDSHGCYGYRIKGEDCIRLIDRDKADKLRALGYHVPHFKTTGVNHTVHTVDLEALAFTCELTGQQFNGLEYTKVWVYHQGRLKATAEEKLDADVFTHSLWHFNIDGTKMLVKVTEEDWRERGFTDDYRHGGRWLDTPENRKACEHVRLHEGTYGANQWAWQGECVEARPGSDEWHKKSDCALVFDDKGVATWVPTSGVEALKATKRYVQVAPRGKEKALSHVDNPNLVVTLGKRRCVSGWHEITKLYDGNWDYSQNVTETAIFGFTVPYSDKQRVNVADLRLDEAFIRERYEPTLLAVAERYEYTEERVTRVVDLTTKKLRAGVGQQHFFRKGDMLFRGHRYEGTATLDAMRAAAQMLATMSDEQIAEMLDRTYVPIARNWQHHALLLLKILDEFVASWSTAASIDRELTATAHHIRDERFAAAA